MPLLTLRINFDLCWKPLELESQGGYNPFTYQKTGGEEVKRLSLLFVLAISIVFTVLLSLSACGPAQYILNTSVSPEGAGTITPAGGKYVAGTEVTLVAEPMPGYAFDHWSGDVTGTTSSVAIAVDNHKSITANFKPQYALITAVSPSGAGTVAPVSGTYDAGTRVTLTASAAEGYIFDHWSEDINGSTNVSVTIVMDRDKSVNANFKELMRIYGATSALEAQQAVQKLMKMYDILYAAMGIAPANWEIGTPTLVIVDGVQMWKVPLLSSSIKGSVIYVRFPINVKPN